MYEFAHLEEVNDMFSAKIWIHNLDQICEQTFFFLN